jgi:hypothetical protein
MVEVLLTAEAGQPQYLKDQSGTLPEVVDGRHIVAPESHQNAIMKLTAEGSNVWHQIIWNPDPGGNIEHVEEHGLSVEDVEHVLANPEKRGTSRSSGNPCVFGHTPDGTYIIVAIGCDAGRQTFESVTSTRACVSCPATRPGSLFGND